MRKARLTLGIVCSVIVLALSLPDSAAAAPSVTLSPSSGNPPSVSGRLAGSGWLCASGSAPVGGATVSGNGVGGSATVNRDGSLSGSFTVRGNAGDRIEVKVTASTSCPGIVPIYLQAIAYFTFTSPSPTATATTQPTATSTATATRVQPTATPVPPTATPVPPTATPAPPSATPQPASTATATVASQPSATATATSRVEPSPSVTLASEASATSTATATPSVTPTALMSAPTPSATAAPPIGFAGGQGSLVFVGCLPSPSQVNVEFLPLGMLASTGKESTMPSGPPVRVTTAAVQDAPGRLSFQPPAVAEAGRVYRVSVVVDDPKCLLDAKSTSQYWLAGAGKDVLISPLQSGETVLEVSNNGDKPPKPLPEVKGAFVEIGRPIQYSAVIPESPYDGWETNLEFWGSVKDRKQRFRWSTDLTTPVSATLQVGLFPFAKGYEKDPFTPPGLLASWPVDCVNCEFVVDLSALPVPEPKAPAHIIATENISWFEQLGQLVASPFNAIGNFFGDLFKAVAGLFNGSKEAADQTASKEPSVTGGQAAPETVEVPAAKVSLATPNLGIDPQAKPINPPVFTTFYFRVLPLKDGSPAGSGSSAVVMHWGGDSPPAPIQVKLPTATPTPTPSAYEVEIVSYHGVIPPLGHCTYGEGYVSYVVTEDTTWVGLGTTKLYKKGDVLCEPAPKEPDLFEKIGDWVSGAWDWAAEAYSDLKGAVISAVGFLIPDTLCSDSCVGFLLDAALVSMGIPPDIPNLDQLMSQGLDYLAQQTVAQFGLPPEVLNQTGPYAGMLLAEAEAKFKEEAQAKIKEGLQQGVKQIQLGYADSAGWLPKGVPVRPNDYQPAGMAIKVTRKPGMPGGVSGCTAYIANSTTIPQSMVDNPPAGYENLLKTINEKWPTQALGPGKYYYLYPSLNISVPPLAPGTSVVIPMSFTPQAYTTGWHPLGLVDTSYYFQTWGLIHLMGTVHLSVYGCGSASLDVAASGSYGPVP